MTPMANAVSDSLPSKAEQATKARDPLIAHSGISSPWAHWWVFLVGFAVVTSRRPDAVLRPQFFAEDAVFWYKGAYELGWRCLLLPFGGYVHTAERLVALFAQLFPFALAPLIMNLAGIVVLLAPVHLALSPRFASMGGLGWRFLFAAGYLALPNTYELFGNTVTIQWHLALLACLIVIAQPAGSVRWQVFDIFVLVLLSVTSPTAFLLLPLAVAMWWWERNRWSACQVAALVPGSLLQLFLVLFTSHERIAAPLGATATRFFNILARQMFLSPLLGMNILATRISRPWYNLFGMTITLMGLALMFYAVWKGPLRLKIFIVFGWLIAGVSLAKPLASPDQPQWEVMQYPGITCRYWLVPMLAFLAVLVWVMRTRRVPVKYAVLIVLLLMPYGIISDWNYPRYPDLHFQTYARKFALATPGTTVAIPINPPGWGYLELQKR